MFKKELLNDNIYLSVLASPAVGVEKDLQFYLAKHLMQYFVPF